VAEPQVSVVIDTYNYGRFIEEAIDSALSQVFPAERMEVLVIDDGSTDDTAERVKKYGSRIQYIQKANGGQASAFNFGFARARGEIISLLDADDYWFPDKLRSVVEEFEKNPEAGVVYHPMREYHVQSGEFKEAHFTPISGFVPSSVKQVILYDGLTTTTLSFRRRVLQALLPIPEELRIQADAYIGNLAIFLAPVVAIDRPLGIYRLHGENLYFKASADPESKRLLRRIETRREIVKGMTSWFVSHGYEIQRPEIQAALLRWIILSERDEFELSPPNRIRFFRHLLRSYRHTSRLMTPRIRTVNYVNAIGALIVGYKRFHILDETRQKASRWLRHAIGLRQENVRFSSRKPVRRHELDR
jgi:glycosyltransferase involved in cell wall biosynthesis